MTTCCTGYQYLEVVRRGYYVKGTPRFCRKLLSDIGQQVCALALLLYDYCKSDSTIERVILNFTAITFDDEVRRSITEFICRC